MAIEVAPARQRWLNDLGVTLPAAGLAGVFLLLVAYPYIELVLTSLERAGTLTLSHYADAFTTGYLLYQPLLNSLLVCVCTGLAATAIGTALAWLVARTDLPGRQWIGVFVAIPQIIPSFQLASSWIVTFSRGGVFEGLFGFKSPLPVYGALPLVFVQSIHVILFSFLGVLGALSALDPTLEEAAMVVGLRRGGILRRITLPIVLPAILSAFLLTFANCMESLGAPLLLGTPSGFQVLTAQIYELATSPPVEFGEASVLSIIIGLVAVGVLVLNLRLLAVGSYVTVTGKGGGQSERLRLGGGRWPAAFVVWLLVLAMSLVPLIALLLVSLLNSWGRGFGLGNLTLAHFQAVLHSGTVQPALQNAVSLGLAAGCLSVAFGLMVAYGTVRYRARWAFLLDRLSFLAYATPGLVIGLGFILAFSHRPINLYNTYWILLGAYFVRFAGVGVRTITAKLTQLSAELEEAGAMVGLSRLRILTAIVLPLIQQVLGATAILVFISVIKEISATSILAGEHVQTLSYIAFLRYTEGDYTTGSAISVLMIAIALLGSGLITVWSRSGKTRAAS